MSQSLFSLDDKQWNTLVIAWWQWRVPRSMTKSPGIYQYDENTICLPYSPGYPEGSQHTLTIPSRKNVIFPVITAINSYAENNSGHDDPTHTKPMESEQDLIEWAKQDIINIAKRNVTINGKLIHPSEQRPICTEVFDIEYPDPNVWEGVPGPTRAITAGYWILLHSLEAGRYQISTRAACVNGLIQRDTDYDLTVV